jgi:hypothetical protein
VTETGKKKRQTIRSYRARISESTQECRKKEGITKTAGKGRGTTSTGPSELAYTGLARAKSTIEDCLKPYL